MILLEYEKAVADIKKECSNMKYGIFKSRIEMDHRPEELFDVIENDEWTGAPEEVFNTKEAALAKLKEDKYSSCISKMRGTCGVYYDCLVYFVAACEYSFEGYEDDDVTVDTADIDELCFSYDEDIICSPVERHLKIEPKKFKVKSEYYDDEFIEDGCKVTTEYDEVYFNCRAEDLENYVKECYSDEDILEKMKIRDWYCADDVEEIE